VSRLPEDVSLDLGALLEPLGVAIHASRRAQLPHDSTVLVFGAGAVGLLVAAMARISGATTVVIADIDQGRVDFAVKNKFAHKGYTVPLKRGSSVEENLEIAKGTATEIGKVPKVNGKPIGEVDAVFECTGVPSCLQAAIYVGICTFRTRTQTNCYRQPVLVAGSCSSAWVIRYKRSRYPLQLSVKLTSLASFGTPTPIRQVSTWWRKRGRITQISPN
jgi:hypothetical protein